MAVLVAVVVLGSLVGGGPTAHGAQVEVEVRSRPAPEAGELARTFTAVIRYLDGHPVEDGSVTLRAEKSGASPVISHFEATPSPDPPPTAPDVSPPTAVEPDPDDDAVPLRITFRFGAGDLANLAIRFAHLATTVVWTLLAGLTALAFGPLAGDARLARPAAAWTVRLAPWLLLAMVASGAAQGIRATPSTGGVLDPARLAALPFGEVYLGLVVAKTVLFVAAAVVLWLLRRELGRAAPDGGPVRAPARRSRIVRLAVADLVLLGVTYAIVVVMNYLHMISHLADFYV